VETDTILRILIVEDTPTDAELAERELRRGGLSFNAIRVETKEAFLRALEEFCPDLIISDYAMPHFDGMQALELTLQHDPTLPFIVLTGSMNEETAVECMKAGAADYVIKEHITRLPFAVKEALERKRTQQARVRAEKQLQCLRAVDQVITASLNLPFILNVLLEHITSQLEADAAAVFLLHPRRRRLQYTAGRGFRTGAFNSTALRLGETAIGGAALGRRIIHLADPGAEPAVKHVRMYKAEGFVSSVNVPLTAKGKVIGVLSIFYRRHYVMDAEALEFLKTLAGQAAIAIDNVRHFENMQLANRELAQAYDATIEGWAYALELRDQETEGHTRRVAERTVELARAMGVAEAKLVNIRRGALLHDIGKMGIPDAILLKTSKLTNEEWEIMCRHPRLAFDMLFPIDYLRPALQIPYCHHEKWDGSGYPRGLKGEEIPLAARLFAVVDVYDAITSNRPYRPAWSREEALTYIRQQSGKHFEPRMVQRFLNRQS